jgi:hypothetical protein
MNPTQAPVPPVRTDPTVDSDIDELADESVANDLDYRRKHLFWMPPPTRTGPHGEEMQSICGKWFEVRRLKRVWGPSPEHCRSATTKRSGGVRSDDPRHLPRRCRYP